jgi:hypothetical protein
MCVISIPLLRRDSVVGISTRLQAGRSGVRIPAAVRLFFLLQIVRLALGPTQPPIQSVLVFVPAHKAAEA